MSNDHHAVQLRYVCLLVGLCLWPLYGQAKTPGKTSYCVNSICHKVKTVAEVEAAVGHEEMVRASFYDDCKVDPGRSS